MSSLKRSCLHIALFATLCLCAAFASFASEPPDGVPPGFFAPPPSIHQEEWEAHRLQPPPEGPSYPLMYTVVPGGVDGSRAETTPIVNRTVYGFMPYWVVNSLTHVRWDLVTHVAYFSVGLNSDGSLTNFEDEYYKWPTGSYVQALISAAHANGVKVTLAATNFSSTEISMLLASSTYRQNAINNLKNLVVSGGGDGVNIDLEGVPLAQKTNLVTFMTDLTAAFHTAIPGSHVSVDTPAVDWAGAFDYDLLAINSDGLFIMGYDYYWSGSSTAGPCSPLTSGGVWGTHNVTWTVDDYLTYGGSANRSKFILGLPYYGREWPTSSTTVPSSTTGSGVSKIYNDARANAATYGRLWDGASQTPYYVYTSSGAHQGWYDDAESLGYKWDLVNTKDLGGTGMWAMNYDTADDYLWNKIQEKFATAPGSLSGVKIGIDPGHGGTESGAIGPTGLKEKDVNLAASLLLRDALDARGAECFLTRTSDATVSLTTRTDYFNSIPVNRSESYHHNACGSCGANYTGVHVYADSSGNCLASATSKDMAKKTALRLDAALDIGVVSSNCDSIYGVHGDNFHMVRETAMPAMLTEASFIDNSTEEALLYGDTRRCLIAGAIAKGIEDHYGVSATDPPCAGSPVGTCANPKQITSFPYSDSNTTSGKTAGIDGYSCPPDTGSEAGPEVVYSFTLREPGSLTVTVNDGTGVDIDPHLLSACDPLTCIARNNTTFTVSLWPGTYYLVCDTWTNDTGTQYPGAYTLSVTFTSTAGDTVAPAVPQDLMGSKAFSGGWTYSWNWSRPLDRLGNTETMGYYQLWRTSNPAAAYTLFADNITAESYTDNTLPAIGTCWFYQLHFIDSGGQIDTDNPDLEWLVDNPQASYVGSWSTGNTAPGHYGDDYRYCSTDGVGAKTATWGFVPDENGLYDISVYYPAGTNRSPVARFTVTHAGGSVLYIVNQQVNGGQWNLLGSHWLTAGASYTLVLDNGEPTGSIVVIADAARWLKSQ